MRDTFRWDDANEEKRFYCVCRECGWESEECKYQDDLTYTECPECHSDHIHDRHTWMTDEF